MSSSANERIFVSCSDSCQEGYEERESDEEDESDDEDEDEYKDFETIDSNKGDFNHGDIIANKYVLIRKIGYGTFSSVWLGYLLDISKQDKKYYAIKRIE